MKVIGIECGEPGPDLISIRNNMTPEQLAIRASQDRIFGLLDDMDRIKNASIPASVAQKAIEEEKGMYDTGNYLVLDFLEAWEKLYPRNEDPVFIR